MPSEHWLNRSAAQFRIAWRSGPKPKIGDFLAGTSKERREKLLRQLLSVEIELRQEKGESPTPDEYEREFPDQITLVRSVFADCAVTRTINERQAARVEPDRASDCESECAGASPSEMAAARCYSDESEYEVCDDGPAENDATCDRVGSEEPFVAVDAAAAATAPFARSAGELDETLSYVALRSNGQICTRLGDSDDGVLAGFTRGTRLQDRYVLDREIGRGGMGVVLLGRDLRLGRPVAIKVMLPARRTRSAAEQKKLEAMFAEEARLGANLSHPAIATVLDYGIHGSLPYTVFEYVAGEPLRARLKPGERLPLEEVQFFLSTVAQALDCAHACRVVHRDLKPENIRVTEQGHFKILDLGLAKEFDRDADWCFAGTPAYASPEQAAELAVDGRADQYALAAIVYEMLLGRRLFSSHDRRELLRMHREEPPRNPSSLLPSLPKDLCNALLRALSKSPNDRFGSCEDFARAMGCRFVSDAAAQPEILLEADVRPRVQRFKFQVDKVHLVLTPESLWTELAGKICEWPLGALRSFQHDEPKLSATSVLLIVGCIALPALVSLLLNQSLPNVLVTALSTVIVVLPVLFYFLARRGKELRIAFRSSDETEDEPQTQSYRFSKRRQARLWYEQLRKFIAARPGELGGGVVRRFRRPVPLLRRKPNVQYQLLGLLEVSLPNLRSAERGMQIRGAMVGADAVIELQSERRPLFDRTVRRLTGTAVRVVDRTARIELIADWFSEQAKRLSMGMLIVTALFLAGGALTSLLVDTKTPYLKKLILPMALCGWPLVIAGLVRCLRWPQLAEPAALTFAGWGIGAIVGKVCGSLLALLTAKFGLSLFLLASTIDPTQLAATTFQLLVAHRLRQAFHTYRAVLPRDPPEPTRERTRVSACAKWAAVLFIITVIGLPAWLGLAPAAK